MALPETLSLGIGKVSGLVAWLVQVGVVFRSPFARAWLDPIGPVADLIGSDHEPQPVTQVNGSGRVGLQQSVGKRIQSLPRALEGELPRRNLQIQRGLRHH